MEPVEPMSVALEDAEAATEPHAPIPLNASDLVTERSRERTHAVPLNRAKGAGRSKRRSRTGPHERKSPSKRAKPSSPARAEIARPNPPNDADIAAEAAEDTPEFKPAEVALEARRGHASAPTFLVIGVRRRLGGAIMTTRVARALDRWRKPDEHAQQRRLIPPWMWVPLNALAIILVAQACIVSAVESPALNKAVAPFFQAFVGVQPYTFNSGPTPHPVDTPAAFIATMLPYARRASQTLDWPVSMILAQWGVEHGWTLPDFDGWNEGNVKAFDSPIGVCYGATVVRGFCAPKTPGAGLAIYIHAAQLHYYSGIAVAARQGGPNAAARALGNSPWDAGHYTVDNSPGDSLLRAMQAFNLYRYDTP